MYSTKQNKNVLHQGWMRMSNKVQPWDFPEELYDAYCIEELELQEVLYSQAIKAPNQQNYYME